MTLCERVKKVAKSQGKSLTSLAIESGLGGKSIYKWKNHQPTPDRVAPVAKTLGVSVDYLLGTSDDMYAKSEKPKVDIKDVAKSDSWDEFLSSDGRPLSDHDKNVLRALFGE